MTIRRHSLFHVWLVGLAIGLTIFQGCTTWSAVPPPITSESLPKKADHIRIELVDRPSAELWQPYVARDSLFGLDVDPSSSGVDSDAGLHGWRARHEVSYALADIRSLETGHGTSGGLVVGVAAAVVLLGIIVASAGSDDSPSSGGSGLLGDNGSISCPLVYSRGPDGWRLDSGTFGGAIFQALQRTDLDNLLHLQAKDGLLEIQLRAEAPETEYVNGVTLLAVDHPADVTVAPGTDNVIHTVGPLTPPRTARDFRGADALSRVAAADGWGWESSPGGRDPARDEDVRDGLILEFPRPVGVTQVRLVLDARNTPWAAWLMGQYVESHGRDVAAWFDSLVADPERARRSADRLGREGFLKISLWTGSEWAGSGVVREVGPEVAKRVVVPLDLAGAAGDRLKVRLEFDSALLVDRRRGARRVGRTTGGGPRCFDDGGVVEGGR